MGKLVILQNSQIDWLIDWLIDWFAFSALTLLVDYIDEIMLKSIKIDFFDCYVSVYLLPTPAIAEQPVGRVFSGGVCDFVCVSVCVSAL